MHAAFHYVGHPKLLRDLPQITGRTLKSLRGGARDNLEVRDLSQPGQDFVLHSFREVSVRFIFTQIVEGQDRDRFLRNGGSRHCRGGSSGCDGRNARNAAKPPEESAADCEQERQNQKLRAVDPLRAAFPMIPGQHERNEQPHAERDDDEAHRLFGPAEA